MFHCKARLFWSEFLVVTNTSQEFLDEPVYEHIAKM
jgi:hypothetical protein